MLEFILLFLIVVPLGTWVGAYTFGVTLWKKCNICDSHITRTTRGWILTTAVENEGFTFVEETECDRCCGRSRQILPRSLWPNIPTI